MKVKVGSSDGQNKHDKLRSQETGKYTFGRSQSQPQPGAGIYGRQLMLNTLFRIAPYLLECINVSLPKVFLESRVLVLCSGLGEQQ